MPILFRITTVPISLQKLITGQLPFMRLQGLEPIMISAEGPEVQEVVEEQASPHIAITLTRKISPLKDLIGLWQFYKLCKQYRPAIIHSHTPKAGLIGMLGGKLAGVPIRLHTVAGLPLMEAKGIERFVLEWVEKLTYASATKVYPNSENLQAFILQNRFCQKGKLKVIGKGSSNGIDTTFFRMGALEEQQLEELRNQMRIAAHDFVFVFIGRMVKDKGIQELVEAFIALQESFQNIKLLLVGPLEEDLDPLPKATLQHIEANPAILTAGYQKDVRPYLAISQALVFPSYREGFPNVPMQAGCFELPCIVSDINGCNEIILEGENGLLVPPKDPQQLLEAMQRLLVDQALYARLRKNARQMIVDRYEQTHIWKLLLAEYQEQIGQPSYV
jgi:glycosyltransferase involved in cell wall biosynthesis